MIAHSKRWQGVFAALIVLASGVCARADQSAPTSSDALAAYIARPDSSYGWHVRSSGAIGGTRYVELIMSSQTWRDTLWRHQLYIIVPANLDPNSRQALLYISGGRWKPELENDATPGKLPNGTDRFIKLTQELRTPVAVLRHVPFQPLFDGLTEDRIIALTFDRYLETGDNDWPLLLPMVKTVVRAMDTIQTFAAQEWGVHIDSFTVAGASKRGWTTWLTGAVDARATALAPIVIDVVNMGAQMKHASATWGAPSPQIAPYTERHLPERLASPGGQSLLDIVDPYSYRHSLLQPKLIINGTNDKYWPLDALNLYWSELEGEKYILYVPNQGHDIKDYDRVIGSLVALHRHVAHGAPLPKLQWQFVEGADDVRLELSPSMKPRQMLVWTARSDTQDFRDARWESVPMKRKHDQYVVTLDRPRSGYVAMLGEGKFTRKFKMPCYFSTTVKIFGPTAGPTVLSSIDPALPEHQ